MLSFKYIIFILIPDSLSISNNNSEEDPRPENLNKLNNNDFKTKTKIFNFLQSNQ
jgi:hypothetical protein